MTTGLGLHGYFTAAAARHPSKCAVVEPGHGSISYSDLDRLSDRVRDRLAALGVRTGDRVGIYLRKSIDSVAVIQGILKSGAAYIPVDPGAPAERNAFIMSNCGVKVVLVEDSLSGPFAAELDKLGAAPSLVLLDEPRAGAGLRAALDRADSQGAAEAVESVRVEPGDVAYILYTSGSTGRPKGVTLTHENAITFVDWCSEAFQPLPTDRFSSHAPFHFDLSILDLHVCFKHGSTLVLIGEDTGKDPVRLARLIAAERISIWYSAPSILSLLAQFGDLPAYDFSSLRHVLFAGEVFAVKHFRTLCDLLPGRRYFNLYGPTETNVCTWYEVRPPVPPDRTVPYPIGKTCSHLRSRVIDDSGGDAPIGAEGELCISGPGVMKGYWGLPDQTARAFLTDAGGVHWYRTGDIVVEAPDGNFTYRGRRDRMVKRRAYRVELGEIEAGLYRHARVKEAAVVALPSEDSGVQIVAFLSTHDGQRISLIEMKRFCSEHLPLYMIPDRFSWLDALPKTSTDKIDYQRLKTLA